jgi:hypothetical protein
MPSNIRSGQLIVDNNGSIWLEQHHFFHISLNSNEHNLPLPSIAPSPL